MTIETQGTSSAAAIKGKKPQAGTAKAKTLKTPVGKSKVSKAKVAAASKTSSSSSSTSKINGTKQKYGVSAATEKAIRMIAREEIKKAQGKGLGAKVPAVAKTAGTQSKKQPKPPVPQPSKKAPAKAAFTNQIIDAVVAMNPHTRQASRQQIKTYLKANTTKSVANLDAMVNRALTRGHEQDIFLFPKGPAGRIMVPMASLSPQQRALVKEAKEAKKAVEAKNSQQ